MEGLIIGRDETPSSRWDAFPSPKAENQDIAKASYWSAL
jgi:hypothetical protein